MLSRMAVTKTTRQARHPGVVFAGVVASVALHALLFTPILFGGGTHHHTPDAPGTATNADRPGADGALLVELISEADGRSTASAQTPPIVSLLPATVDLILPPAPPDIETNRDAPPSPPAPGDESLAAHLYGMYVGQINARIERAWLKPRTSTGADRFVCRVQVLQSPSGDVQEITLLDCNGDARWKSSLVRAIQTASPFPAAPDPRVFRKHITLQFASDAFVAGGSSEGFEPEALTAMLNVGGASVVSDNAVSVPINTPNAPAPYNVIEQLRFMRNGKSGTVELRIVGSTGAANTPAVR